MTTPPELQPEEIRRLIDEIVAENHRMEPHQNGRVVGRAQHRKHHGCVAAVFQVADKVPMKLRHGVFANSGERGRFKALIRFSNGRQQDDRKADVHGMAIKLLDVEDKQLDLEEGKRPDGQDWQTAQDSC